jgi:probable HAF family extracellular repeat protein
MTVKTWRWFAFAAPLFAAWAVDAKPHYREVDVSSLGNALPFAINDSGVIAMQQFVGGQIVSFLYDSSTGQVVRTFQGDDRVTALSDNGNAAGTSRIGGSWFMGPDGVRIAIPTLQRPLGVNDAGVIAGFGGGFFVRAVVYSTVDGTSTPLSLGGTQSAAFAINSSGQVAGWSTLPDNVTSHAFRWTDGTLQDLGTLGGSGNSIGNAIDEDGRVVGRASTSSGEDHAFLYDRGGMQDLGTLPGCTGSEATGINDKGAIVGASRFCASFAGDHVFLYRNGRLFDLNALAPAADGSTYARAVGINGAGSIVGFAVTPAGSTRAFLLVRDLADETDD